MLIHKAFMVQRKVFALCLNFLLNVLLMIFITTPTLPLPLRTPPPLTPPPQKKGFKFFKILYLPGVICLTSSVLFSNWCGSKPFIILYCMIY